MCYGKNDDIFQGKKVQMLTNSFHIQKHSVVDGKHQQYEYLAYTHFCITISI